MIKTDFSQYDKAFLQQLISESTSIREILLKLGLSGAGGNHVKLSEFLKNSDYDISTLVGRKLKKYDDRGIPKKKLSEQLCINGTGNSNKLRMRLINSGIKEYKCEYCGTSMWNGIPVSLELHHINGNHYDNRLENIIILCPNCHAQTANFRGKNSEFDRELSDIALKNKDIDQQKIIDLESIKNKVIIKKERPIKEKRYCQYCGNEITGKGKKYCSSECAYNALKIQCTAEELLEKSKTVRSLSALGRLYNVTVNAVKKWIKKFNIEEEVKANLQQHSKQINQYDLNGNFIKSWKDANEIYKVLGYSKSKIQSCCSNYQKTSYGFIWKYKL